MAQKLPIPLLVGGAVGLVAFLGIALRRGPGGGLVVGMPGALAAEPGKLTPNFPYYITSKYPRGSSRPRRPFRPGTPAMEQYARTVARQKGLPEEGFVIQLWTESGLDANTKDSSAGARGIAQFMPATGVDYGLVLPGGTQAGKRAYYQALADARANDESTRPITAAMIADPNTIDERKSDPRKAIRAAATLMKHNYDRWGNWSDAVAAYNYGSGGVRSRKRGVVSRRCPNSRPWCKTDPHRYPDETARYVAVIAPYYGERVVANPQIKPHIVAQYQHPLSATVTV